MFPLAVGAVSILVFIEVDDGVGAEIYRIRTGTPGTVILVGIKYLRRQRFPSTGRAAY